MSRYATRAELVETIKHTVETDHNNLGTPKALGAFNVAAIVREVGIIGDRTYGYTMTAGPEEFAAIVKRNVRASFKRGERRIPR
jgi:hypothetical protein